MLGMLGDCWLPLFDPSFFHSVRGLICKILCCFYPMEVGNRVKVSVFSLCSCMLPCLWRIAWSNWLVKSAILFLF